MDATDWPTCDSGRSFAAIDFETPTSERNSACAVGVVVFNQGSPVARQRPLIRRPGNRFDPSNVVLHGIGPADTGDSPPFPEVWEQVAGMLDGHLVVAHNTAFDMSVLRRSAEHYDYGPEPFPFACTYRLARSAMPEARSWGLKALAAEFGIPLTHHDPLSDAQAAGGLWLALPERFNTTHPELLARHGFRLATPTIEHAPPPCHTTMRKPLHNATARNPQEHLRPSGVLRWRCRAAALTLADVDVDGVVPRGV